MRNQCASEIICANQSDEIDETKNEVIENTYIISGELIAGRVTRKNNGTEEVLYYHLDHLNSTKMVTNQQGTIVLNYEYRAFGTELDKIGSDENRFSYIGREFDEEINLYYVNARYYDATIGRFINVDPIQDGWNWYIYCNNNPLKFVDPSGLSEKKGIKGSDICNTISVTTGAISSGLFVLGIFEAAGIITLPKSFLCFIAGGIMGGISLISTGVGWILSKVEDSNELKEFRKKYKIINNEKDFYKYRDYLKTIEYKLNNKDEKFINTYLKFQKELYIKQAKEVNPSLFKGDTDVKFHFGEYWENQQIDGLLEVITSELNLIGRDSTYNEYKKKIKNKLENQPKDRLKIIKKHLGDKKK